MSAKQARTCFETSLVTKTDFCYINKLNDDCLVNIFKKLPIITRIRAEIVCKRWKNLIEKSWNSVKEINYRNHNSWSTDFMINYGIITDETLKKLLDRFGKYLIKIDLSETKMSFTNRLTGKSMRNICESCPKLRSLNLGGILEHVDQANCNSKNVSYDFCKCEPRIIDILINLKNSEIISSLTQFGVQAYHVNLRHLGILISQMKSLQSLQIHFFDYDYYEDTRMLELPYSTLNEIIFEECSALEENILIEIVMNVENLCTLILSDVQSYRVLQYLIPSQCELLKNLYIRLYMPDDTNMNITQYIPFFQTFVNLERLNLFRNPTVSDQFLEILSTVCKKLIFLDIGGNDNVTDSGIKHIATLPNLKCLFITCLDKITGENMSQMANLEELNCYESSNVEEKFLIDVIQRSKLKVLDVRYCKHITTKFLLAVIEELNIRKEKLNFTLVIKGNKIKLDCEIKIPREMCILEGTDNCGDIMYSLYKYFPDNILYIES